MSNILVIEDDSQINDLIVKALMDEGYLCTSAFSGTEGLLLLQHECFDLILLDLMLPGLSGEELLKKVKNQLNLDVPFIVLSAKDEIDTKVNLLTLGAEDYLTKPFEIKELKARVMVQLRKKGIISEGTILLKYKDLELNKENFSVRVNGEFLSFTRQEFKILELLMSYPDKIFSKQAIYDYAWGEIYIGEDKTINVHISNIRQKLKKVTLDEYIETVWGIGFKLCNNNL